MIEAELLTYLAAALPVLVCMEEPEQPPAKYVRIEKTGSSRSNFITQATFAFQSYGPSLFEAAALNESVKAALDAAPVSIDIFSAKLNSDYNFTDTATKRYRYQAVYDFTF